MYDDDNHVIKIALESLKILSIKLKHPRLAEKCEQLQAKFTCNPETDCSHNQQPVAN